jgi:chloramphenicol O-acetyltransferase
MDHIHARFCTTMYQQCTLLQWPARCCTISINAMKSNTRAHNNASGCPKSQLFCIFVRSQNSLYYNICIRLQEIVILLYLRTIRKTSIVDYKICIRLHETEIFFVSCVWPRNSSYYKICITLQEIVVFFASSYNHKKSSYYL